jgi:hypothetical protein
VGAGGAETATVTLEGVTKAVSLSSGSTTSVAYQLSKADYSSTGSGWDAEQVGATVVFLCRRAKVIAGTFTLTSTGTAAGTFVTTRAGGVAQNNWLTQASDFLDPLDGTGDSEVTLSPGTGNVYEIAAQYLGYGPVVGKIEVQKPNQRPYFLTLAWHEYLNANTTPTMRCPSLPWSMRVESLGSTTALSVKSASLVSFIGGELGDGIDQPMQSNSSSSVSTTEIPLLTLRNGLTFNGAETNNTGVRITYITFSARGISTSIFTFRVRRNTTLTGTPNFTAVAAGTSACYVDKAATGLSGGTILIEQTLLETTNIRIPLNGKSSMSIEPGDTLTWSVIVNAGTQTGSVSIEFTEKQ